MADPRTGPAQVVLTASIARQYYLEGRSKSDIAGEFGLSRFKVARLLESALDSGLVRIEIRSQGDIDVDLSTRLQDRFGLQHSVVVDTPEDDPITKTASAGSTSVEVPEVLPGMPWCAVVFTVLDREGTRAKSDWACANGALPP